ncbi:hypothetical protein K438DRAFT_1852540 [Mycena galopus ATCC 62051]|nr:hypothetical protein K438DRAFT_1852540 [Mycena galopus ATCC 62051]
MLQRRRFHRIAAAEPVGEPENATNSKSKKASAKAKPKLKPKQKQPEKSAPATGISGAHLRLITETDESVLSRPSSHCASPVVSEVDFGGHDHDDGFDFDVHTSAPDVDITSAPGLSSPSPLGMTAPPADDHTSAPDMDIASAPTSSSPWPLGMTAPLAPEAAAAIAIVERGGGDNHATMAIDPELTNLAYEFPWVSLFETLYGIKTPSLYSSFPSALSPLSTPTATVLDAAADAPAIGTPTARPLSFTPAASSLPRPLLNATAVAPPAIGTPARPATTTLSPPIAAPLPRPSPPHPLPALVLPGSRPEVRPTPASRPSAVMSSPVLPNSGQARPPTAKVSRKKAPPRKTSSVGVLQKEKAAAEAKRTVSVQGGVKKRGRPPKEPLADTTNEIGAATDHAADAALPAAAPKKRGRPRKQPLADTTHEIDAATDTAADAALPAAGPSAASASPTLVFSITNNNGTRARAAAANEAAAAARIAADTAAAQSVKGWTQKTVKGATVVTFTRPVTRTVRKPAKNPDGSLVERGGKQTRGQGLDAAEKKLLERQSVKRQSTASAPVAKKKRKT